VGKDRVELIQEDDLEEALPVVHNQLVGDMEPQVAGDRVDLVQEGD